MKWNNFYSNNGSLLLVSTPLIFSDVNEIGFRAIPNSFGGIERYYSGNYGFPKSQLFTEVQFVMGLKKEQFFTVTHRQVVNKHVSLAIDYRRIKSDGYLNRQTSEGLNFSASLTQKYANERYNIYTRGYYEKIVLQENGGILDVAQVDNKSFVSKQLLDITLPEAKNYKQVRGGEIENRWNFGNLVEVKKDTVISKKVIPTSAIWHKITYSEINRVYKDTLPGAYYERYYFDADSTNEIQSLTYRNDTILISKSNQIILPKDNDRDSLNELQTIRRSNDTLYLSKGNFTVLPKVNSVPS